MNANQTGKINENHPELWHALLPMPDSNSNKYSRGFSTVIGGYPATGASRLAAMAAERIGSGLTQIIAPENALAIYASALLSIMVKPFANPAEFNDLIADSRISSFLIGPGAGVKAETHHHVISLLKRQKPVVIDADAITVFENDVKTLSREIDNNCVLTPHEGEFKRLFKLGEDRQNSVLNAAEMSGAVVLLKGHQTLIASPSGQLIINKNAPASLATGGSGDVLAGMICGLAAQGMPLFYAAAAAVWIHAEAAKLFGIGLIAEDIPALLPKILQRLHSKELRIKN